MMQSQRIVKNVLAGGISTAIGGLLQVVAILLIARHLSVAEFGIYSFMAAFAFALQRLADLGTSNILMRDMAVKPGKLAELLGGALPLAWVISFVAGLLMLAAIWFLHFDLRVKVLTEIMGLAGLSQFICGCYGAVLRSQEDNELHALGVVLQRILLVALVFTALELRTALTGVTLALLISNLCQWWFYRWIVINRYVRPKVHFDFQFWKYLLTSSIPIGGAAVVRLLGEQADIIVLTWLVDLRAVAFFSAPYKLVTGLRFIPQAMVIALFPMYSRAASSRTEFHEAYERGIKGFLLIGVPLALLFVLAPRILCVGLLGARYQVSTEAMRLLGIGLLLLFAASPFPFLLTALNEQSFLFVSSAIGFAVRVVLDVVLTASFGFTGPCLSLIASEGVMVAMWVGKVWRLGYPLPLGDILWRPCVAGALMGAIVYFVKGGSLLSLAPFALASTAIYFAAIVKLGAFSKAELAQAREGLNFVRPLVAGWSRQLQRKPQ
jgi:O-antigen/teichoic acid export membrane protein